MYLSTVIPYDIISFEQVPTNIPSTGSKSQQSTLQLVSQDVSQH